MITSSEIKELAMKSGADLSGIAPVERFVNAPVGFHPSDIYSGAKSVIAIAIKEPESSFYANSPVPYTYMTEKLLNKLFDITLKMVLELEKRGVVAIVVPSEPYEYWDKDSMTGKGILSLKHTAYLAGLGVIGRNTLLLTKEFGNLVRLSALIINVEVEGDPIQNFKLCSDSCNLCISSCPVGAIENGSVTQKKCRTNSHIINGRGNTLYTCNNCRKVCPSFTGTKNAHLN
jgi:epoxyqueuosine reductase QueG